LFVSLLDDADADAETLPPPLPPPASSAAQSSNIMNNMNYMSHGGDGGRGPPPPPPPQQASLESKVQEMASTLRGECDKALRAKMLAVERYHLKRDEVSAASDSLRALQGKLGALQDGMQGMREVVDLQRHVDDLQKQVRTVGFGCAREHARPCAHSPRRDFRLTHVAVDAQVAFQHEELVTLTDKDVGQQTVFGHDEQQRSRIRSNLLGVVAQQRQCRHDSQNNGRNNHNELPVELTPRQLQTAILDVRDVLEDDRTVEDERWRSGAWSQLTLGKARDLVEAAAQSHDESEEIRRLLRAYRHHLPQLGLEDDIDIDDDDDEDDDDDDAEHPNPHAFDTREGRATAAAIANDDDYDMEDDHRPGTTHDGVVHHHHGTFFGGNGGAGYDAYSADDNMHESFDVAADDMAGTFPAYHNTTHHHHPDDPSHRGGQQQPYDDPSNYDQAGTNYDQEAGGGDHEEAEGLSDDAWDNHPNETRVDPTNDVTGPANNFDHRHETRDDHGPLPEETTTTTAESNMEMSNP
jgi:hypothetical protein